MRTKKPRAMIFGIDTYFASFYGRPFWKPSLLVFPEDSAGRKVEIFVHRSKVCVQRCVCEKDNEFVAERQRSTLTRY